MKSAIVIEKIPGSSYLAYVPDLPGCVATGETPEVVERLMQSVLSSSRHIAELSCVLND